MPSLTDRLPPHARVPRRLLGLALVSLSFLLAAGAAAPPASAKRVRSLRCPHVKPGRKLKVYAIGSSTMGSILAPILKDEIARMGASFHFWGKASSGLARPDFHDWPEVLPGLMERRHPDVLIISLGTNDGQALSYYKGRKPKGGQRRGALGWAKLFTPEYAKRYAARVDALLAAGAGPHHRRPIIWLGPTGHPTEKYNKRMRYLRGIILKRIKAFDGDVVYLDGLSLTLDKKTHTPKARVHVPHRKDDVAALQRDGMHLTTAGARWFLAEPLLRRLRPCVGGEAKGGKRRRGKVADRGAPRGAPASRPGDGKDVPKPPRPKPASR